MQEAAAEQRFEDAARERNRLRAVRSLLERQRVASGHGRDARRDPRSPSRRGEANAQVFQVRDGVPVRPTELLPGQRGRRGPVGRGGGIHPPVLTPSDDDGCNGNGLLGGPARARLGAGSWRGASQERRGRGDRRDPGRGTRRTSGGSMELASATRGWTLDQEKLRSERRRQQRVEALDWAPAWHWGWTRSRCGSSASDISTLMGTNTVASMVRCSRAGRRRSRTNRRFKIGDENGNEAGVPDDYRGDGGGALASDGAVGAPARGLRPHDKAYDPSLRRSRTWW